MCYVHCIVYDHTYRWYLIISKLHTNCTKEPTPSAHNPACKELLESVGDNINLETPGARIKLVIENQSRLKGNSAKLFVDTLNTAPGKTSNTNWGNAATGSWGSVKINRTYIY